MEMAIENAIETIDSARGHKFELENRKSQLLVSINQVSGSAFCTKQEIELYFTEIEKELVGAINARKNSLIDQVNKIEMKAIGPLKDCETILNEKIEEASVVLNFGENLLNSDVDSNYSIDYINKFVSSTSNLSLNSVPEVPLPIDVPSISVCFSSQLMSSLLKAIHIDGKISEQSPVQIINLEAIPGGIVVSWANTDETAAKTPGNSFLYKLQSHHGKLKLNEKCMKIPPKPYFKDEYVGENLSFTVRNLISNSIYTFRVSRCQCTYLNESSNFLWSPWSVYQEKMTTMPGYTWAQPSTETSYLVSNNKKVATKKSAIGCVLHCEVPYLVGYPVTFRLDTEGKYRSKNDCIAICTKVDLDATGIHTKEGTCSLMLNGQVWVNGTCSQTKFSALNRGVVVSFRLDVSQKKSSDIKNKLSTYRATITVGEHEAVFDWIHVKAGSSNLQNFVLTTFFQAPGWRVSII